MNPTLFVPFFEAFMQSRFQRHWWSWMTMNEQFSVLDIDERTVFDYFVLSEIDKYTFLCTLRP